MNRWALAVLAIAVVGCQQTQPAGSPFAAFQPTRLGPPTTGSYGMAKSASAAGAGAPGGSTVPPSWPTGGAGAATTSPPAVTPMAPAVGTPAIGGGLGGTSAVPPNLPPSGNDSYYNPGTSSTTNGSGAAGISAQPLPGGAPMAGVSPSGSFGVGGSFASPGTGYGSPIAGFAPQGGVAAVGYDQPVANPTQPVVGMGQPAYYGPTASAAGANAAAYGQSTYGQPAYGQSSANAASTRPSLPSASGVPSTWTGGGSSASSAGPMQWRSR
ncbi:MAG TPA: hypothetical protein VGN57_14055 [Pirellulaceae bacterium]|jgi:nucleoporin NUP159|nr:hypothetical protein [Pirellulaceae bacterium]